MFIFQSSAPKPTRPVASASARPSNSSRTSTAAPSSSARKSTQPVPATRPIQQTPNRPPAAAGWIVIWFYRFSEFEFTFFGKFRHTKLDCLFVVIHIFNSKASKNFKLAKKHFIFPILNKKLDRKLIIPFSAPRVSSAQQPRPSVPSARPTPRPLSSQTAAGTPRPLPAQKNAVSGRLFWIKPRFLLQWISRLNSNKLEYGYEEGKTKVVTQNKFM